VRACQQRGEIATGLLFLDESSRDMHDLLRTTVTPLVDIPFDRLCPGSAALDALMARYR
jgi:2-oxoglutarate ferredoxin oxidoreductase subunit beta